MTAATIASTETFVREQHGHPTEARLPLAPLFDKLRKGDVLVVRWVDRSGRNYADLVDTVREFMRRGVVIRMVINNMTFEGSTKDPMQ